MPALVAHRVEKIHLEPTDGLAIRMTLPIDQLPAFFGEALTEMAGWIRQEAGEAAFAGPPFARYHSLDPAAVDVEAVFPLTRVVEASGRMHAVIVDGGEAVQVMYVGPYDAMEPAFLAINEWLDATGHRPSEPPREVYLTDPVSEPDPANWRTLVIQPYL